MLRTTLLLLLAACSSKITDDGAGDSDDLIIDGEAYTLELHPVLPPDQSDLFSEIDQLQLIVTQGDGEVTTHVLSVGDTTSTSGAIPRLNEATLSLVGKKGPKVVLFGQTPPLSVKSGEHTQRITVARVDSMTALGELPVGLGLGAVAAGPDGKFYLFGGADEGIIEQEPSANIYWVDLGSPDTSLSLKDLGLDLPDISDSASGRMGHQATALKADTPLQGQILITGGTQAYIPRSGDNYTWAGETLSSDQAFLFDPASGNAPEEIASLTYPRYGHVAVENHLGEVVIIGGFNDYASAFTQPYIEAFVPEEGRFRQVSGVLGTGTSFHAAARLGEHGVMSCGGVTYAGEVTTECFIIPAEDGEIVTMDWPGAPMLSPSMVTMSDDRILLTGGLDFTGTTFDLFESEVPALSDAWIFEDGAWRPISSMAQARAWHTAVPLPDGRVLITGGVWGIYNNAGGIGRLAGIYWGTAYDPLLAIPCAEIFDPTTETFTEVDDCDPLSWDAGAAAPTGTLPRPTLLSGAAVDPVHGALFLGGIDHTGSGMSSAMYYRPAPEL